MKEGDFMDRLILILFAGIIMLSILTYILHRLTSRKRFIKYLLPIFILIPALYNFYQSRLPSEGFEDLGSFIIALFLFVCFLSSLISGLFIDFIFPKLRKR